jgi:uncharacterized damage-inducible protein DinB
MIEFWKSAISRQFHAALDMLANAIDACPDSIWTGEGRGAFWYLAFHVLFFADLYLSPVGEENFQPPAPFGTGELEDEVIMPDRVYSQGELLAYLEHCRQRLDAVLASMTEPWVVDPCPFPYRNMGNGELLLYNMRHVQHHAAQLNLLLRQKTNSAPRWVSKGPSKR